MIHYLQTNLPSAWSHFSSDVHRQESDDALALELLQSTYALTRESNPELYALADEVAAQLSLTVPVELYQGSDTTQLNAMLVFHPTSARVVFEGPLQDRLRPEELRAVLGHELAHHLLWTLEQGQYLVASRLLASIGRELESAANTERLFRLHTEVFCDQWGMRVTSLQTSIETLVKVRTGLKKAVAADFLTQSHTLLDAQGSGSREWSHPEAHIRALALEALSIDEDAPVQELIEGPLQLDALDFTRREEVHQLTRTLIGHALAPPWTQTEAVLGHYRLLFDDDLPPLERAEEIKIDRWGDSVRAYLVALLLDLVVLDPALEDLPLKHAHRIAESLTLQADFEDGLRKILKRKKRDIQQALESRDSDLEAVNE